MSYDGGCVRIARFGVEGEENSRGEGRVLGPRGEETFAKNLMARFVARIRGPELELW